MTDYDKRIIFAIDNSGSTAGCSRYWEGVQNVLREVSEKSDLKSAKFLLWNSECTEVILSYLKESIAKRRGCGGTSPITFARWISQRYNAERFTLYLITDGEVSQSEVDALDQFVPSLNIIETKVYIFGSGSNFSVSAPFTRKCNCAIAVNEKIVFTGDTDIDFEKYATVESFLANFEHIRNTVVIANMGRTNDVMRESILKMKKLYLAEIAESNSAKESGYSLVSSLVSSLEKGLYEESLINLKKLLSLEQKGKALEVESKVCEILNLCQLKGQFNRDALLNTNRANWANNAIPVEAADVELLDVSTQKFECPITLDIDVPVLLITDDHSPILQDVDKAITEDIVSCPLSLVKYPKIVEKLKTRVDHPIGQYGFKELFRLFDEQNELFDERNDEYAVIKSPLTVRQVMGGIPLGCHEQHVKVGNYMLAKMFTGGKLIGNSTLWLCAVFYVIKRKVNYLSSNHEFMKQFEEHILYRLRNYKTTISLSGLPQYPLVKVPISVALWYCVVTSDLVEEKDFRQERFLQFFLICNVFVELLDLLKYPFNRDATKQRGIVRYMFSSMMRHSKEVNSNFKDVIRSFYQNHLIVNDGRYVFLDGEVIVSPHASPDCNYSRLPLNDVVYLASLVDPSKSVGDVFIPKVLPSTKPMAVVNWEPRKSTSNDTLICIKTLRPYSIDPRDNRAWIERCVLVHGCQPTETCSAYANYIKCVVKLKKFPTLDEFLLYLYNSHRNKESSPRNTLPQNIVAYATETMEDYAKAMTAFEERYGQCVSIQVFKDVTSKSCPRVARLELEQLEKQEKA